MSRYILYKAEEFDNTYCIAEVLNEGLHDLLMVEEDLIKNGYVITEILCNGKFIRCVKEKNMERE